MKTLFRYLILVYALSFSPVGLAEPLIDGLGGSVGFGEQALFENDDESTAAIDLGAVFPNGLRFFGTTFTSLFINNNGNITFNQPFGDFTPTAITGNTSNPIIAPFFADVDTTGVSGNITPGDTSRGTNLVYWDLDVTAGIFTVTWDDVGYFEANTDKVNAFQLRIFD